MQYITKKWLRVQLFIDNNYSLGLLITRVSEPNSEVIWLSLCTSINHESDHLRDISCMGLKNIISAPNMDNAIALNIFVQVKEIFILVLESVIF